MAVLNLEEERERLQSLIDDPEQFGPFGGRLSAQMKLVQALEQLEQAREAHRNMTRYASERMLAHLDKREGDVYHELQALKGRFGYKQQEVGDERPRQ